MKVADLEWLFLMKERLKLMERCLELVRLARRRGEPEEAKATIELELEFGAECERLRGEVPA